MTHLERALCEALLSVLARPTRELILAIAKRDPFHAGHARHALAPLALIDPVPEPPHPITEAHVRLSTLGQAVAAIALEWEATRKPSRKRATDPSEAAASRAERPLQLTFQDVRGIRQWSRPITDPPSQADLLFVLGMVDTYTRKKPNLTVDDATDRTYASLLHDAMHRIHNALDAAAAQAEPPGAHP